MESFTKEIVDARESGRCLVWMDECMFTKSSVLKRTWGNCNETINLDYKRLNIKTTAICAAITEQHGVLCWKEYGKSVNKIKFMDFIQIIRKKIPSKHLSFVFDNIAFHRSKEVRDLMDKLHIQAIYTPPYAP